MKRSILLVHGSFHTAECWELLLPHLAAQGFDVRTITLSGHRGNPKPPWRVSMASYGADVIAAAQAIGAPCLLLGHSMGGMVISDAAERRPDLFAAMVYLSAYVPKFGKSSMLNLEPVTPAMRTAAKVSWLKGTANIDPEITRQVFYNRCTAAVQDRAIALLCPQPMRASMGSVKASAERLGSVPKHYIECLDDAALPLGSQRGMQGHMKFETVQAIDSDHSPFLCKPAELADLISRAAAA
jgi:pimeloyl-ACP methyl ester carboxylesterase